MPGIWGNATTKAIIPLYCEKSSFLKIGSTLAMESSLISRIIKIRNEVQESIIVVKDYSRDCKYILISNAAEKPKCVREKV